MATIYITEKTREMLDVLAAKEKRGISDEAEFLCENRIKELGLPDVVNLPSVETTLPNPTCSCQDGK